MKYPESLELLIESFKTLPGVGEKTAKRYAFALLELEEKKRENFSKALINVGKKIKHCSICNNITENDICEICTDESRADDIICVVEDVKKVMLFEENNIFNGKYHILDDLISPFNGVNPEDVNIPSLLKRVKEGKVKEIIIAVKPTIEGETTSLYISKLFENTGVIISKIAQGVPMGADMEYLDVLTLETAINDRKKIS